MIHGIEHGTPYVSYCLDKERAVVVYAPNDKNPDSFQIQIHNSNPATMADYENMKEKAVQINSEGRLQTTLALSIEAMQAIVQAYFELAESA